MAKRISITVSILTILGVLMIYSASMVWAEYKNGNEYYYLIRQTIFALLGFAIFFFISKINHMVLKKYATPIFILGLFFLILVLIPGVGLVRGGARSWLGINQLSFQPSEFMKVALIIFCSRYLARVYENVTKLQHVAIYMTIVVVTFGLIMLEPDFGSGFIIVLTMIAMLVAAGIKRRYVMIGVFGGLGGIIAMIISAPYRISRIFSYLDPWSDPLGGGFQIIQSLYAISPAGILGIGLFNSRQKYFYLPEPQTDFIFAIITEELGLLGGGILIILFCYFFYLGILTALKAKDNFSRFLAFGITANVFIQFFINISVVIGLLPVTGVTLPFLSYGGTSLLINLLMAGILVGIAKENEKCT